MELNYNFNATVTTTQNPKQVFAIIDDYSIQPISPQEIYLINPSAQKTLILKDYMGFVVQFLETFRSEEEHLNVICAQMGLGSEAKQDILTFFRQLREADFLVSPSAKLANLSGAQNNLLEEPPLVLVRTAGRVAMLKRFLESAAKNEAKFYADYHYLIIDDSSPEQVEANAVNIADSGLAVTHFDKSKQQAYLADLKQQFTEQSEVLDYLLGEHPTHSLGTPYGRTWNWGLLLSAGRGVVFLDDDCLLNAYAAPLPGNNSVKLGSSNKDIVFLTKKLPIAQQLQLANIDPIASLASHLGVSLAELKLTDNSFIDALVKQTNRLQARSKIVLTTQGVAGEPGSSSPIWLYNLSADSEARFLGNNEAEYNSNKTERFAWTGHSSPKISYADSHSLVARAMDNCQLLPATLPIMRNEDAVFTHLINYLYPFDVSYENTWAIEHLPEIERKWDDNDFDKPIAFNHAAALSVLLKEIVNDNLAAEPNQRLQAFVNKLKGITNVSEAEFTAWLYAEQQAYRAMRIHLLQDQLASHPNAPAYWQKDVQRQIESSVGNNELYLPDDLSAAQIQQVFKLFVDGLAIWPSLWQFGKDHPLAPAQPAQPTVGN